MCMLCLESDVHAAVCLNSTILPHLGWYPSNTKAYLQAHKDVVGISRSHTNKHIALTRVVGLTPHFARNFPSPRHKHPQSTSWWVWWNVVHKPQPTSKQKTCFVMQMSWRNAHSLMWKISKWKDVDNSFKILLIRMKVMETWEAGVGVGEIHSIYYHKTGAIYINAWAKNKCWNLAAKHKTSLEHHVTMDLHICSLTSPWNGDPCTVWRCLLTAILHTTQASPVLAAASQELLGPWPRLDEVHCSTAGRNLAANRAPGWHPLVPVSQQRRKWLSWKKWVTWTCG